MDREPMADESFHRFASSNQEKLIEEMAPMIRYLAQRLSFRLPPSLDIQDLIHAGVIGLMDAISKYDPSKETRFRTYAEFRVRGAMLDQLRALDWVPRSVREKIGLLQKTMEDLIKRYGRSPSEEEIAHALGMQTGELHAFLFEARGVTLMSLEDVGVKEGEEHGLLDALADSRSENPLLSLLSKDLRNRLLQSIEELPEKERIVISLYYHDELTMKEIAQVLGVTESRVCQLHGQAILRLKGSMKRKTEDGRL